MKANYVSRHATFPLAQKSSELETADNGRKRSKQSSYLETARVNTSWLPCHADHAPAKVVPGYSGEKSPCVTLLHQQPRADQFYSNIEPLPAKHLFLVYLISTGITYMLGQANGDDTYRACLIEGHHTRPLRRMLRVLTCQFYMTPRPTRY
jgi:hypothetical protein